MYHISLSPLRENEILLIKHSVYILSNEYPQYQVFSRIRNSGKVMSFVLFFFKGLNLGV